MPDISETTLPGIGLRHEFGCANGTKVGVVSRRSGRKELVVYDRRDPDAVKASVDLSPNEAAALGELLGGSQIVSSLRALTEDVEGLTIDWVALPSHFPPGPIAERAPRSRTGVTVVAIVRAEAAMPAPGPDEELRPGDTAVIIGTTAGVAAVASELAALGT
jgi:TrkA domain protein